jgi:hypothetical protein
MKQGYKLTKNEYDCIRFAMICELITIRIKNADLYFFIPYFRCAQYGLAFNGAEFFIKYICVLSNEFDFR